jgi:tRNA(fMet)-specific endonuclease VapC
VSAPRPLLLDTNVVLHISRASPVAERVEREFHLKDNSERSLVSAVSVGEALAMAERNGWGDSKWQRLRQTLSSLILVDISSDQVLSNYATIDTFQKHRGLNIGQNDVWIAATARAIDACLITTDRDFDGLHGQFVNRVWIDPKTSPPAPS